jgi:hypothetical protein
VRDNRGCAPLGLLAEHQAALAAEARTVNGHQDRDPGTGLLRSGTVPHLLVSNAPRSPYPDGGALLVCGEEDRVNLAGGEAQQPTHPCVPASL